MYYYRDDPYSEGYRVWSDGWAGDVFEIIAYSEWEQFKSFMSRLSLPLNESEEGD